MTREDKEFMTMFTIVLGVLMLLAVIFLIVARITASTIEGFDPTSAAYQAIEKRVQPVGDVAMSTVPRQSMEGGGGGGAPKQVTAAPAEGQQAQDQGGGGQVNGKQVFDQVCAACHAMGVAGAPKAGDQAAWAPRIKQGVEVLYQSALKGKGTMPPKGGNPSLTEAQVKAAVDYMMAQVK